jgi:hypothetical protein
MKLRERNMDNEMKGLEARNFHKKVKVYASELGNETEVVRLKERLSVMMKPLKEIIKKHHRCGWKLRRRVIWPIVQLFSRKLKHRFDVWMNIEEKLRKIEYGKKSFGARKIVHICELEQRAMVGDNEKNERPRKIIMECMESVFQHREEMSMLEGSRKTDESQYFQTNCLF